jgi:hypothetical protein
VALNAHSLSWRWKEPFSRAYLSSQTTVDNKPVEVKLFAEEKLSCSMVEAYCLIAANRAFINSSAALAASLEESEESVADAIDFFKKILGASLLSPGNL